MTNERLVEVFRAEHDLQAHMVRDRLEAEGIAARVDGDFLQGALGGVPFGWASAARVLVAESDAPVARKIIAQASLRKSSEDESED